MTNTLTTVQFECVSWNPSKTSTGRKFLANFFDVSFFFLNNCTVHALQFSSVPNVFFVLFIYVHGSVNRHLLTAYLRRFVVYLPLKRPRGDSRLATRGSHNDTGCRPNVVCFRVGMLSRGTHRISPNHRAHDWPNSRER